MGRLLLGALLLAAACGDNGEDDLPAAHREILDALNRYRQERGAGAVALDETLTETAAAHAEEMARMGYFSHFSPVPENRTPLDRMIQRGWPKDKDATEFISRAASADVAFHTWINKPKQAQAMVIAAYRLAGIGRSGDYWVLILG